LPKKIKAGYIVKVKKAYNNNLYIKNNSATEKLI